MTGVNVKIESRDWGAWFSSSLGGVVFFQSRFSSPTLTLTLTLTQRYGHSNFEKKSLDLDFFQYMRSRDFDSRSRDFETGLKLVIRPLP